MPEPQTPAPQNDKLLIAEGLEVSYGTTQVLWGVSFNTAYGRAKPGNLERDPRVSVLVTAPDFYHWIAVSGAVELTTDDAEEQIDRLSRKYDGKPWPYVDGQRRVRVRVVPEHVTAYGV